MLFVWLSPLFHLLCYCLFSLVLQVVGVLILLKLFALVLLLSRSCIIIRHHILPLLLIALLIWLFLLIYILLHWIVIHLNHLGSGIRKLCSLIFWLITCSVDDFCFWIVSSGIRSLWILMYSGDRSFVFKYIFPMSMHKYFAPCLALEMVLFRWTLIVSNPAVSVLVLPS